MGQRSKTVMLEYNVTPLITVIIPTYNLDRYVRSAIDSVLRQTYRNVEIIVVDDGSNDNTRDIVKIYEKKRVNYIFKENGGLASARNAGVANSSGELIAFLDADDVWIENKLTVQFENMLKRKTALVGCGYYWVDTDLNILEQVSPDDFKDRGDLLSKLLLNNVIYGSGSGVLLKRECFERVGFFDENLSGAEDWDMWLRIAKYFEISFVKEPLVKIRCRLDSMSSARNAEKMLKNELLVLDKFFDKSDISGSIQKKRKSYSYRYYKAALAFKEGLNHRKALGSCLNALTIDPLTCCNKNFIKLLLSLILSNAKTKFGANLEKKD